MAAIRPSALPPAITVANTEAVIVDDGATVRKATPAQVVDAGRPISSQAQAEAGTDNATAMTPLRVRQAMLTGGSGGGSFVQVGAGAVTRTMQDKARESVSVEDFADGLAWNDDWGPAFTNAGAAVANGGVVHAMKGPYSILSEPFIPEGVTIKGPYTQADQTVLVNASYYGNRNGVVYIGNAGGLADGLNVNASGCWDGAIILRAGMVLPYADATDALTQIASFAGTALNIAGPGVTLKNLLIFGFNKAIYSNGMARVRCTSIRGDCNNGIEIIGDMDIPQVDDCHFWPYTSMNQPYGTAYLVRPGTAYKFQSVDDWARITRSFSYGYFRGFHLDGVANVTVTNCGADNVGIAGNPGAIGFVITGNCNALRLIGCQTAAQETGYYYNNTGTVRGTMIGCDAWSCTNGIDRVAGDLTVLGGNFYTISSTGILNEHATALLSIDNAFFTGVTGNPISSTVVTTGVTVGHNAYGDYPIATNPVHANIQPPLVAPVGSNIPAPRHIDTFSVGNPTGTNIASISNGWAGRTIHIGFSVNQIMLHATGSPGAMALQGSLNFPALAGNVLSLTHVGGQWYEISRKT